MDNRKILLLIWILWNKGHLSSTGESPFFIPNDKCDWHSCEAVCQAGNGRLIIPDSQEKFDLVWWYHNSRVSSGEIYIALYATADDCTRFLWNNGDTLSWSRWESWEPDRCDQERCVRLYDGMFRTAPCSKVYDALCEYVNQETTSSSTAETTSSTPQTTSLSISTMMAETTSSTSTMMAETTSSTTKSSSPTTSLSSSTTTAEVTSSPSESSSRTTFLPTSITTEEATTSTATESTDRSVTSAVSMITTPSTTCDPALTRCVCKGNLIQLSPSELQESINTLKTNLAIMKNSTAIARRKRISVYDSRPSSQAVGGVACGIMSVLLGWIVIADLVALIMNICSTKPA